MYTHTHTHTHNNLPTPVIPLIRFIGVLSGVPLALLPPRLRVDELRERTSSLSSVGTGRGDVVVTWQGEVGVADVQVAAALMTGKEI